MKEDRKIFKMEVPSAFKEDDHAKREEKYKSMKDMLTPALLTLIIFFMKHEMEVIETALTNFQQIVIEHGQLLSGLSVAVKNLENQLKR